MTYIDLNSLAAMPWTIPATAFLGLCALSGPLWWRAKLRKSMELQTAHSQSQYNEMTAAVHDLRTRVGELTEELEVTRRTSEPVVETRVLGAHRHAEGLRLCRDGANAEEVARRLRLTGAEANLLCAVYRMSRNTGASTAEKQGTLKLAKPALTFPVATGLRNPRRPLRRRSLPLAG